jgi:anti-anti-sigma regulatory factor
MTADRPAKPGRRKSFAVAVDQDECRVQVAVQGELDQETVSWVALWLTPVVLLGPARTVVIDLSLVTATSAEAIDALAELVELAQHRRRRVRVVAGAAGTEFGQDVFVK